VAEEHDRGGGFGRGDVPGVDPLAGDDLDEDVLGRDPGVARGGAEVAAGVEDNSPLGEVEADVDGDKGADEDNSQP